MQFNQEWSDAIANLAGNHSFRIFLDGIHAIRDDAVNDATLPDNIASERKTMFLLGKVAFAREITDLFGDYTNKDVVD
jgi:hypothetical protein